MGTLPAVAEGAEYTELAIGDSPETATFTKYGGYIPLTLELIDRDETRKLRAYPRELAAAGLRQISGLVAAIFTANAGVGPTMADGGALFNATAVTTAGGHANLLTTALSAAQWETVQTAVYNQPLLIKNEPGYYGTGPKMAINPKYLLVPRALQLTARKILYPELGNDSQHLLPRTSSGASRATWWWCRSGRTPPIGRRSAIRALRRRSMWASGLGSCRRSSSPATSSARPCS